MDTGSNQATGGTKPDPVISMLSVMLTLEAQMVHLFRNLVAGNHSETQSVYAYGDTVVEIFVSDEHIKAKLERDFWLPVFLADRVNARIASNDGKIVVLCGFGKQKDREGNLILFRVTTGLQGAPRWSDGLEAQLLAGALLFIDDKLRQFGVRWDRNMIGLLWRN
jgi:hypothetical protein